MVSAQQTLFDAIIAGVHPMAKCIPIEVVGHGATARYEISQNGEEAFHYRREATYAGHLGQRCLEKLWLFQLVLRLKVMIY